MSLRFLLSFCLLLAPAVAYPVSVADHPYLEAMVNRLADEHGLDRARLVRTFERVQLRPQVVEAMQRPAERLPWHRYRSFFINPSQIRNGVEFWQRHRDTLSRAAAETGVPEEIMVAVIGIETRYGTTLGSHPVLDSLTTLTLQYPRRREFFGKQLEHFLLLTDEESLDPFAIRGSYAGAIGIPQFMPSSYRQYAVDFSGDGVADLVNQTDDAIGSVANYLGRFKWRSGEPVAVAIDAPGELDPDLVNQREPSTTLRELRKRGIEVDVDAADDARAGVMRLEGEDGNLYRVVFDNFYVIMRYNPSFLYAMAVHELGSAVKREFHGG
ncbi:MAG TPA: lytic murein transglycosylase B [Arenicellales bacterium]|nr:lytic murein transglycosylase B [Arenicellales bacterium]